MTRPCLHTAIALLAAGCAAAVFADSGGGTTVYRQVMPDGRIVYADKVLKGGKLDETITVEPPIKGNPWTTASGKRPSIAPRDEPTPVSRVNSAPPLGRQKTIEEANSDVIRAEMLLEDAQKRRKAGIEPLPGERTANAGGGSRLNDAYWARQQRLEKDVAQAEAALKRASAERDALRKAR